MRTQNAVAYPRPLVDPAIEHVRNAMLLLHQTSVEVQKLEPGDVEHRRKIILAELEASTMRMRTALTFLLTDMIIRRATSSPTTPTRREESVCV